MKRNILPYMLAAVLLLPACSKDDNNTIIDENGDELMEVSLNATAPTINTTTKAVVDQDNWTTAGHNFGVLGLANSFNWDDTSVAADKDIRLIDNAQSTIAAILPNGYSITLDKPYAYPAGYITGLYKNYSFYSYYPYATVSYTTTTATCTYTLDGTQDILWGIAVAEDKTVGDVVYKGYNARYLRKGGEEPNINFNHLLTRFTFKIIAGNDPENNIPPTELEVRKIIFNEIPTNATLTIAQNNATGGELYCDGSDDIILKNADGTDATATTPGTDTGVSMGESIMVPSNTTTLYKVSITIGLNETGKTNHPALANEEYTSQFSIEKSDKSAFVKGDSHEVTLTVNGMRNINISATLTPWNTGEDLGIEIN